MGFRRLAKKWIRDSGNRSRTGFVLLSLLMMIVVGLGDYLSGYRLSFLIFYLVPISLAAWFVGWRVASLVSLLSIVTWIAGDWAAGLPDSPLVLLWNGVFAFCFFLVVVWLLTELRSVLRGLEETVLKRTEKLSTEMAERERLERELLKIVEREQRRIGHELHDGLCQHLTASALAAQVLGERLEAQDLPEAIDAGRIVNLIEEAIGQTRDLARGLFPVRLESDGLAAALFELAKNRAQRFQCECIFRCEPPTLDVDDAAAAVHFYRIAQEAALNAIKHGRARHINIELISDAETLRLRISDDGAGLPESWHSGGGMGIRIMAHRALMIGAEFSVQRGAEGGTIAECSVKHLTLSSSTSENILTDE